MPGAETRGPLPGVDPVDLFAEADPVAAFLEAHDRGRLVAMRTSGTTGTARSVVRTTGSWVDSFPSVRTLTACGPGARVWVPGPPSATMNLFAAVLARYVGAEIVAQPASATHAHLTPSALGRLLGSGLPLDGMRLVVAGDRLSRETQEAAGARGATVSHYYGAAELSFVAWGSHEDDLGPFPGVEVEARAGVLWARSPYLALGYRGVRGPMRRDGSGFATVGDRGRIRAGRVVVAGRGDAAVTTGGATVLVAEVEDRLRSAGAGGVVVVGVPHPALGQVLAAVLTDAAALPPLRAAAASGLAPAQRPRRWYAIDALPLTGAGKIDRAALVDRLLAAGDDVRVLS